MTEPLPDRMYDVVCPACSSFLGRVFARHSDHLAIVHMERCKATPTEKTQAIYDVEFARTTGDTSALEQRIL